MVALPHQRRKSERPDELLDAALALLVERGFAATRMEDVAQRAGVSKGTVYLYWSSKEDLLRAVIARFLGGHLDAGDALVGSHDGSAVALLRGAYAQWWLDILASPASGVFKLMLAEAGNFPDVARFYHHEVVERGQGIVRRILVHGIASGEFRSVDVETAVFSLLMPMVMLCVHQHSLLPCAPQDTSSIVRRHIDLLLAGLLTPGSASKIEGFPAPASPPGPGGS